MHETDLIRISSPTSLSTKVWLRLLCRLVVCPTTMFTVIITQLSLVLLHSGKSICSEFIANHHWLLPWTNAGASSLLQSLFTQACIEFLCVPRDKTTIYHRSWAVARKGSFSFQSPLALPACFTTNGVTSMQQADVSCTLTPSYSQYWLLGTLESLPVFLAKSMLHLKKSITANSSTIRT